MGFILGYPYKASILYNIQKLPLNIPVHGPKHLTVRNTKSLSLRSSEGSARYKVLLASLEITTLWQCTKKDGRKMDS